jgi:hypothetical protein
MSAVQSGVRRSTALLGIAVLCLALCGPADAQYQYGYGQYPQGYGYQQGGYYGGYSQGPSWYQGGYNQPSTGLFSGVKNWFNNTFGQNVSDGSGIGRTAGGAAGMAAGLASAVIKSAGVAAMGPIAPILIGTAVTAGGAFLGGKLLSRGGSWMDNAMGPDMTWTIGGAIAGSVAGFALLPALGPFAGPAGGVVGAAVGGLAGGLLGKMFAPTIQRFATPKTIYAAAGAAVGAMIPGPGKIIGILGGAVGGYVLGSIFDKNFFSEQGSSLSGDIQRNVVDYRQPYYAAQNGAANISNWARNTTAHLQNRISNVGQPNYYNYTGYGSVGYNNPYVYASNGSAYGSGYYGAYAPSTTGSVASDAASLADLQARYRQAVSKYQSMEQAGSNEKFQAYTEMMSAKQAYEAATRQGQ